jgi:threonine aldolase
MIRFECDYGEGCHPAILARLNETNFEQTPGYGVDSHCENARALIRKACGAPDAQVEFLLGGTQANVTVISAALRPYQGVVAACTGHINVHETGAVEFCGHKVLPLESGDGKITAQQIHDLWLNHENDPDREHTVQPGMVYISQPTENGTLYSLSELKAISDICRRDGLILFVDGARCGYGLMSPKNDVTLHDLAELTDVFYIGGTKVGALFGEAVVITSPALKKDFRYYIKQHGGRLAKGRLLGIQFETLFENGLYFEIAAHGISLAMKVREAFLAQGVELLYDSYTNQQFPILTDSEIEKFKENYSFEQWRDLGDGRRAVRFCTSWCTPEESIRQLIDDIKAICKR